MKAKILEGKKIALDIQENLKEEIDSLLKEHKKKPTLASIQVAQDAGIESYVKAQEKLALSLSIGYQAHKLDENISEEGLIDFVEKLNKNKEVTAIILQLPLPEKLKHRAFELLIDHRKDAEGMRSENLGNLFYASMLEKVLFGKLAPCTALAAMSLLDYIKVDLKGKEVVVVGHSEIIGKPLSLLLLSEFATVTVCHIETRNLEEHIKRADIVVSAVGKPDLIKGNWIRKGAIVIDVGISKKDGKIVGDIEFDEALKRASFITPVPGGIGPLTVTMLMKNVITLYKWQIWLEK